VLYALVLSAEPDVRQRQLDIIRRHAAPGRVDALPPLLDALRTLDPERRLPLAMLAIRSLKRPARTEGAAPFREVMAVLVAADRKVDLFEFALQRMIDRKTAPDARRSFRRLLGRRSLAALHPAARTVLSCLALWGSREDRQRDAAYRIGLERLGVVRRPDLADRLPPEACTLAAADDALNRLLAARPTDRKRFLEACVSCVAADECVSPREAELLQAIAATLDLPLTPIITLPPSAGSS
jgi:hypothetical protein